MAFQVIFNLRDDDQVRFGVSVPNAAGKRSSTASASTVTVVQASVTSYAACLASNEVGNFSGEGIDFVQYTNYQTLTNTDDGDVTSCCSSCIGNPDRAAYAFYSRFASGQQCQVYIQNAAGTCNSEGQYSYGVDLASFLGPD
jgi:hypothetical protein